MNYPNSMGERELISSLTKVLSQYIRDQKEIYHQDQVYYNAYEKDITIVNIFFGESTVYGE